MGRAFGAPEPTGHGQVCFFHFHALVGLATREPWNTSGQKVQDPGQRLDFLALREIGWHLVWSHDTSVVAEGAPRMYGHLPRIFRNHRIVVAPNIRVVTVPGVKTASSRR
jgi:hypothetical protein